MAVKTEKDTVKRKTISYIAVPEIMGMGCTSPALYIYFLHHEITNDCLAIKVIKIPRCRIRKLTSYAKDQTEV